MDGESILDSLPDGVVIADAEGTVTSVNNVARRLLGSAAKPGQSLREVMVLQDTESCEWFESTTPYAGISSRVGLPEQSWFTPDGTEVLVTGRINRERRGGEVTGVSVVIRSGRGRARLDRERSDLVATVAHELRSPLTGVKGFVGTLLNKWERLNDEQKQLMLRTVHADSERLSRLITELLDVARIDTGRLPLYPRETDVVPIVRRAVESVAAGTSRPVGATYDDVAVTVFADPDKLSQVVTNVVDNAVRHGEGAVNVTVSRITSPFVGALVRVEDEGEGIPEEIRTRIFTKFWKHGIRGGSGLGMYIVNGLVRVHGGTVTVGDSAPSPGMRGGGARIDVAWPADDRRGL